MFYAEEQKAPDFDAYLSEIERKAAAKNTGKIDGRSVSVTGAERTNQAGTAAGCAAFASLPLARGVL